MLRSILEKSQKNLNLASDCLRMRPRSHIWLYIFKKAMTCSFRESDVACESQIMNIRCGIGTFGFSKASDSQNQHVMALKKIVHIRVPKKQLQMFSKSHMQIHQFATSHLMPETKWNFGLKKVFYNYIKKYIQCSIKTCPRGIYTSSSHQSNIKAHPKIHQGSSQVLPVGQWMLCQVSVITSDVLGCAVKNI